MISEIELLQKWLVSHNNREIRVSANSRYGKLKQVREGFIAKYGKDIYNEVITGKKVRVFKTKKIKVLSYEPECVDINSPFVELESMISLNNVETDKQIQGWDDIVGAILGTYWDYVYVKELVIGLYS